MRTPAVNTTSTITCERDERPPVENNAAFAVKRATTSGFLTAALLTLGATHPGHAQVLADVPIRQVDGYILLPVHVNEPEELTLLFDTGCTQLVFRGSVAQRLGLVALEITRHNGDAPFAERVVEGVELKIGDLTLGPIDALLRENDRIQRRLGTEIDGVIGAELLRDHVVEIDYDRKRLTVLESDGFAFPGNGVGYDIVSNRYFAILTADVSVEDGEVLTGRFLIDTGAGVTLALNTPFVNQHDLVRRIGVEHISYTLAAQSVEMISYPGRVAHFDLGYHGFHDFPVLLSQTEAGPLSPSVIAGIIGNRVWRRFNTTFDYKRNRLYLEPNKSFGEPFQVDCSGLAIATTVGGEFVVRAVFEGSPASEAGVLVGDVVTSVDGTRTSGLLIHELRSLLARDGAMMTLVLDRGGESRDVALLLKQQY